MNGEEKRYAEEMLARITLASADTTLALKEKLHEKNS
jgi:hypothetical protein